MSTQISIYSYLFYSFHLFVTWNLLFMNKALCPPYSLLYTARLYRARVYPGMLLICCHICHTPYSRRKNRAVKVVKMALDYLSQRENERIPSSFFWVLLFNKRWVLKNNSLGGLCDRRDSRKHKTPVYTRTREVANEAVGFRYLNFFLRYTAHKFIRLKYFLCNIVCYRKNKGLFLDK